MKRERKGARVVLLTPENRFLLFHFKYDGGPLAGTEYWGLPGGGVEEGESVGAAAVRELFEETGLRIADAGPALAESTYDFRLSTGEYVVQHDWYFLVRLEAEIPLFREGFTPEERQNMMEAAWWRLADLGRLGAPPAPADMEAVLLGVVGRENA